MDQVLQYAGQYWWLLFVFGGSIGGAVKAVGAANRRRAERSQERFRLKQQTKVAIAQAKAREHKDRGAQLRDIAKALADHDRTDARWFAYETDLVTLLDFPLMIDLREPLTVEFHKAKGYADLRRPADADALLDDLPWTPEGVARLSAFAHLVGADRD